MTIREIECWKWSTYLAISRVRHKTRCEVSKRNLRGMRILYHCCQNWNEFLYRTGKQVRRKPGRNKSAGRNSGHDSCCDCRPSNVTSRILLTDNCGEMELDWVRVWFLFGTLSSWIVTCQMRRGSRTGNGGDGGAAGGMLPLVGKGGESR